MVPVEASWVGQGYCVLFIGWLVGWLGGELGAGEGTSKGNTIASAQASETGRRAASSGSDVAAAFTKTAFWAGKRDGDAGGQDKSSVSLQTRNDGEMGVFGDAGKGALVVQRGLRGTEKVSTPQGRRCGSAVPHHRTPWVGSGPWG